MKLKRPAAPPIGSLFVYTQYRSSWTYTLLRVVSDVYEKHGWRVTDKGKVDEVSWKINVEQLAVTHHRTEGVRFTKRPMDMMLANLLRSGNYVPGTRESFRDMLKVVFQ
jgi:hypothetical protein